MGEDRGRVSPLKNFVAGGVAGACLLLAGHPLDTIKVTELFPSQKPLKLVGGGSESVTRRITDKSA